MEFKDDTFSKIDSAVDRENTGANENVANESKSEMEATPIMFHVSAESCKCVTLHILLAYIPLQQKAIYEKFMAGLLTKSSKLRSLRKDLQKNYSTCPDAQK